MGIPSCMHPAKDFPTFGWGLSLRLLAAAVHVNAGLFPRLRAGTFIEVRPGPGAQPYTQRFLHLRAGTFIEAPAGSFESSASALISPLSGGDLHRGCMWTRERPTPGVISPPSDDEATVDIDIA